MTKITLTFACLFIFFTGCNNKQQKCEPQQRNKALASIDSLGTSLNWPADLQITGFSGPNLTPSPACLAVAATGEVFVLHVHFVQSALPGLRLDVFLSLGAGTQAEKGRQDETAQQSQTKGESTNFSEVHGDTSLCLLCSDTS